ncbi:unnamed protein product [Pleuronectes platessa]|uniref:Uncharacterized protein n=1 Tax=Pleuronectes platessa TaxID=8262 RepID=A0A9N7TT09_PLEPL|nr:unnamed protein product [Pleuronectes platessa]
MICCLSLHQQEILPPSLQQLPRPPLSGRDRRRRTMVNQGNDEDLHSTDSSVRSRRLTQSAASETVTFTWPSTPPPVAAGPRHWLNPAQGPVTEEAARERENKEETANVPSGRNTQSTRAYAEKTWSQTVKRQMDVMTALAPEQAEVSSRHVPVNQCGRRAGRRGKESAGRMQRDRW